LVAPAHAQTSVFSTPGQFNFAVPAGFTSATVEVNGAGGAAAGGNGGNGGRLTATLTNLVGGQTLTLFVGTTGSGSAGVRGGQFSAIAFGAGVTRASLIAAGTANGATNTSLLVLAGGGGGGGGGGAAGGLGGGLIGAIGGGGATGGRGGSQTAGGSAGSGSGQFDDPLIPGPSPFLATDGSFLQGGTVASGSGGGGGGGFFGGGGGALNSGIGGAGGGGSSFSSAAPSAFTGFVAVTDVIHVQGGGGRGEGFFNPSERGSITITPGNVTAVVVPEPGSIGLALLGGVGLVGAVIRRRKTNR
jgi:hypothetical protein